MYKFPIFLMTFVGLFYIVDLLKMKSPLPTTVEEYLCFIILLLTLIVSSMFRIASDIIKAIKEGKK